MAAWKTPHEFATTAGAPVRNVFLALLLANLLFLGWRLWVVPPDVPAERLRAVPNEPAIAPLRAVASAAAPREPAAGAVPPGSGGGCYRVGPIADGQLADTLRTRLATAGATASLAVEDGEVWVGHWVQLDAVATREEAEQVVARLAAGGLPDAYVLQTSGPFAISLGVFRDRERADAVAAAAARLGFQARLTDRYRSGLQYWLTVAVPAGARLPLDQLSRESGQILRAQAVPCAGAGIGGAAPIQ
jgi:hypothetical protein